MASCPRCKADWKCPCETCTSRRDDKSQTWGFADEVEGFRCLTCGIAANEAFFMDLDYAEAYPDSPRMDAEVSDLLSKHPSDWRDWVWYAHTFPGSIDITSPVRGTPCKAALNWSVGKTVFKFECGTVVELIGNHLPPGTPTDWITAEEDERCMRYFRVAASNAG